MAIRIDTERFVNTHGREPRGFGGWAFFFDGKRNIEDAFFTPPSTYTQAKALALKEAKRRGAVRIDVGS